MAEGETATEINEECIRLEENAQDRIEHVLQAIVRISLFHMEDLNRLELSKQTLFPIFFCFIPSFSESYFFLFSFQVIL